VIKVCQYLLDYKENHFYLSITYVRLLLEGRSSNVSVTRINLNQLEYERIDICGLIIVGCVTSISLNQLEYERSHYVHTLTDLTDGHYTANNNSPTNVTTFIL
jgi:hypothetical protein